VDSWLRSPSASLFGERVRWRDRARGVGEEEEGRHAHTGTGGINDSGGEAGDLTAGVTARQGWMAVIPCVLWECGGSTATGGPTCQD
jgi:hypothetical protein